MSQITISLTFDLGDSDEDSGGRYPLGPQFANWLPAGRADRIRLREDVDVWFERRARIDHGGFLKHDPSSTEFCEDTMTRQFPLDAGHLHAEAVFDDPDGTIAAALLSAEGSKPEDAPDFSTTERFGKQVYKRMFPPVSEFIDRVRFQFGQYWLRPIEEWDSRDCAVGAYFRMTEARWSRDGREARRFRPTSPFLTIECFQRTQRSELLNQEDWAYLKSQSLPNVSLGMRMLVEAHRLQDVGDPHFALIQAATAIELLSGEVMKAAYYVVPPLKERALSVDDRMKIADRLMALCARDKTIPKTLVADALAAIELRNEVIHKGWRANSRETTRILVGRVGQLIALARHLVRVEPFKLPNNPAGSVTLGAPHTSEVLSPRARKH